MLPLEIIKEYYTNSSKKELKEIREVVYLLACVVMQHFYGPPLGESPKANLANNGGPRPAGGSAWMGGFEEIEQEEKGELKG